MSEKNESSAKKPLFERLGAWIGTTGTLLTIVLTVWNTQTKNEIDRREKDLRALEVQLKARSAGVEESKERVERYKWVLSLLPGLTEKQDEAKRNFTVALVHLALTQEEAEQLFAGLQASSNQELQAVGQSGVEALETEAINRLVLQMNANTAEERKAAVARIERDYNDSPLAITLTLKLYEADRIKSLSPSGAINGLYFLSATDPEAWNQSHVTLARQALTQIQSRSIGEQTQAAMNKLNEHLARIAKRQ